MNKPEFKNFPKKNKNKNPSLPPPTIRCSPASAAGAAKPSGELRRRAGVGIRGLEGSCSPPTPRSLSLSLSAVAEVGGLAGGGWARVSPPRVLRGPGDLGL